MEESIRYMPAAQRAHDRLIQYLILKGQTDERWSWTPIEKHIFSCNTEAIIHIDQKDYHDWMESQIYAGWIQKAFLLNENDRLIPCRKGITLRVPSSTHQRIRFLQEKSDI